MSQLSRTALAAAHPTYNLKTDFGAAGNGVTNDSQAFRDAAEAISNAGGGTLDIPAGIYLVGEEDAGGGATPFYRSKPIFDLDGQTPVSFLHWGSPTGITGTIPVGTYG